MEWEEREGLGRANRLAMRDFPELPRAASARNPGFA